MVRTIVPFRCLAEAMVLLGADCTGAGSGWGAAAAFFARRRFAAAWGPGVLSQAGVSASECYMRGQPSGAA